MPMRPDPIPDLKARLHKALIEALDGWSQANAACLIESNQARVSNLRRGDLSRFSLEQLIRFLSRVDYRIEIQVRHEPRRYDAWRRRC
jgi:predicted XRE-type DNA-binding protein